MVRQQAGLTIMQNMNFAASTLSTHLQTSYLHHIVGFWSGCLHQYGAVQSPQGASSVLLDVLI